MPPAVAVTLLHSRACPSTDEARELLRRAAARAGVALELAEHEVTSDEEADRLGFPGSPTYLVAGVDPFPAAPEALHRHDACRVYARLDGGLGPLPSEPALGAALRAATRERGA